MRIVKNGDVHVSAPRGLSRANIETFINENRKWIAETREKTFEYERKRAEFYNRLPLKTQEERDDALQRLQALIVPMVERHAREMNVKPGDIYYKANISSWGKCNTTDRSICFSAYRKGQHPCWMLSRFGGLNITSSKIITYSDYIF